MYRSWSTPEEIEQAKARITEEFISRYYEFLEDVPNGGSKEFGWKYGILLTEEGIRNHSKDTMKNLIWFQQNIFTGRWLPMWVKEGYTKNVIWDLNNEGFLSYQVYSNGMARASNRTDWYYIPQRIAKEIYREHKRRRS